MSGAQSITDIITDPNTWRLKTPGGIPYKRHSENGHEGTMSWDKVDITEKYLIEASNLEAFLRELYPLPELINGIPIQKYGTLQGSINITATSASWTGYPQGMPFDPFGADPNADYASYARLALVTVTYNDEVQKASDSNGQDPNEADPTTFLEISASSAGEFIHTPIPDSVWQTTPSGDPIANNTPNAPAQIIVPETEWTMTWPRVTGAYFRDTLIGRLRSILGKVNSASYSLLYDAPAETLLFVGWEMSEERQFLFNAERGQTAVIQKPLRVSMKVLEKRVPFGSTIAGHNHIWRPGHGWQKLLINGTDPIYSSYNYENLFAVD